MEVFNSLFVKTTNIKYQRTELQLKICEKYNSFFDSITENKILFLQQLLQCVSLFSNYKKIVTYVKKKIMEMPHFKMCVLMKTFRKPKVSYCFLTNFLYLKKVLFKVSWKYLITV
jgi:hypothetical protein